GGARPGAWRLAGACLGVAGVALIVGAEARVGLGRGDALALMGQGAALLGALMYAGAAIYGRRFGDIGPVAAAAGTMIWATTTLVPAALIVDRPWRLSPSTEALAAAGALGLFCTGVALILYFRLIEALGSMGVASQAYLRAGIGVALGAVVLGEEVAPTAALGLAATILGVALINRPARG
ncbi:MAG: DMT family transporter, partial [Pseudomonadota bacterium]